MERTLLSRRKPHRNIARLFLSSFATMFCIGLFTAIPAFASPPAIEFSISCGARQTSIEVSDYIGPEEEETHWQYEYAPVKTGPWSVVPGGSGTIPASAVSQSSKYAAASLTGLEPETPYYFRLIARNPSGSASTSNTCMTQPLHPREAGSDVSNITETSARISGSVIPDNFETHWRSEFATAEDGPWAPIPGASGTITAAEANEQYHTVSSVDLSGLSGSTIYYVRLFAENEHGSVTGRAIRFETAGAPIPAALRVHALHGEITRLLGWVRPHGFDTHYRFEYVSQEGFEKSGFAEASATGEQDAGGGGPTESEGRYPTEIVAVDVPGLSAGKTYHYRLRAMNTATGSPVIYSTEQTLTTAAPAKEEIAGCPNEAIRAGLSAALPDCRAYELITPANKGGAQDIFDYSGAKAQLTVGEDGEHVAVRTVSKWGAAADKFITYYFFKRQPSDWVMTSATPQPQAGEATYEPDIFNPNLTEVGSMIFTETKEGPNGHSPDQEFATGPPGGPYENVVTSPFDQEGTYVLRGRWVAASADFSKLILETTDRSLVASAPSSTTSGYDLYEWSAGRLRQVNVLTGGAPTGACGANMALGFEGYKQSKGDLAAYSSSHAVSTDGSRVFFEAVPGNDCSAARNLYMRLDGSTTVDVGAYEFAGANADGSKLLLSRNNQGTEKATAELFLYDTATQSVQHLLLVPHLSVVGGGNFTTFMVDDQLTAVYFAEEDAAPLGEAPATEGTVFDKNWYRYDIPTGRLSFVAATAGDSGIGGEPTVSPDGRYFYFDSSQVDGVAGGRHNSDQTYRYDDAEGVVQCMSCASPFDPEPQLGSSFLTDSTNSGVEPTPFNGVPEPRVASVNGDYVFFDSAAELVPQDVNGEIDPTGITSKTSLSISESSDVYEWRKNGVDGCGHVQGCLSLITSGTGDGLKNLLLGTTPSGRDVFIGTHSALVPQDQDTAGDVYDARIGGGFPPPPPPPVECEASACSSPVGAPLDSTPASLTFSGVGNLAPPTNVAQPKVKGKEGKRCSKGRRSKNGRCVKAKRVRRARAGRSHRFASRRSGK